MRVICKKKNVDSNLYNIKGLVLLFVVFGFIGFLAMSLYNYPIIRYSIITVVFIIMFIWLVASAYKKSWLLVGNLGMPYRMKPVLKSGFSTVQCFFVLIAASLICIIWGYLKFRKRDIFEKE